MYKNIKAAVVGSINMDLILKSPHIPECGENVVGTDYGYANGGKGANQATALAKLGAKVKMIGKVADDTNGRKLIENLEKKGIDASGVSKSGTQTGLAAILLDGEGRNRIIVYEGANSEINPDEAVEAIGLDTELLLVQFETSENVVTAVVNHAIRNGITTVIDCGPAKNFALEKMQGATILSPNESETKALTGIDPENEAAVLQASIILKERSKAEFIVLKLGERGCSLYDGKELKFFSAFESKVVDTTAAGDCFTAALALEYVKSGNIEKACITGNKAGSIAVSRLGAENSMPTVEEIINLKLFLQTD